MDMRNPTIHERPNPIDMNSYFVTTNMLGNTPTASAINPLCTSALSWRIVPNVKPRIGPINGEINMLAMIETEELVP
jgi:hypothetical protein